MNKQELRSLIQEEIKKTLNEDATNNQSSIEWFNQQLVDRQNGKGDSRSWDVIFQQAQNMHQKEIEKAYWDGKQDIPSYTSEEYYKETFK